MKLLDALSCPYCEAPLLKESYYFRCGCGHRFRVTSDTESVLLTVIAHSDRREVGRVHAFALREEQALP